MVKIHPIYNFYEKPFKVKKYDTEGKEIYHENTTLICKYCREHKIKPKDASQSLAQDGSGLLTVNMYQSTTSNLIQHFNRDDHSEVKKQWLKVKAAHEANKDKRKF